MVTRLRSDECKRLHKILIKLSSPEHVENEHFEERHSKIQNGTLPLAPAYYKCKWASLQIIMQNSNDRQKLKKDAYANNTSYWQTTQPNRDSVLKSGVKYQWGHLIQFENYSILYQ